MAKDKTMFECTACGYQTPRWVGRCPGCGAWNTLEETLQVMPDPKAGKIAANQRPGTGAKPLALKDIPEDITLRTGTGISELDRVLGGGIVEGGLILIGGDPGIGKSTPAPAGMRPPGEERKAHAVCKRRGIRPADQAAGKAPGH